MANRLRDDEKEAFWRDVVRRHKSSGENVRDFCRREGLAESNFYAWRRTIAQRDARTVGGKRNVKPTTATGARRKVKPKKTATPAFLPVVSGGQINNRAEIVLELGGGRRLRFDGETSAQRLAAVVHALENEASS